MKLCRNGNKLLNVSDDDIQKGKFVIPEGVTEIQDFAFWGCTSLTNLVIPEGITRIESDTFAGCTSLTNVVIPESVTEIGVCAFKGCTSLTNLVIPEGVTRIGWGTFKNCTSLTNLVIPEGVTRIGCSTFEGCTSLTNVVIPEGVTEIGVCAFYGCSSLTNLVIPEGVTEIQDYIFQGCDSLKFIFVNTDNDDEINRIRLLLPAEHRNKVMKASFVQKINECQNETLEHLCQESKINPIFHQGSNKKRCLPQDIFFRINQFLGEDSRYYREAKKEMEKVPIPSNEEEIESYRDKVLVIADVYIKMAQTHKKNRYEREEQNVGENTSEKIDVDFDYNKNKVDLFFDAPTQAPLEYDRDGFCDALSTPAA